MSGALATAGFRVARCGSWAPCGEAISHVANGTFAAPMLSKNANNTLDVLSIHLACLTEPLGGIGSAHVAADAFVRPPKSVATGPGRNSPGLGVPLRA